ncbi:DUF3046 domain-containing protein [Rothia sp. ZJ932]|uniref:DUF3046 domain-containing protein n=1 Tax=Rothia sp. ZJ932 TaxID=2810516 RepID=UPI001968114C|nr:DUF3046 domain-containing protein [Rothia sp. ZJ932]QRZ61082.1 DUF3046 domain-containing protein [Rothia sp. ZJ932]
MKLSEFWFLMGHEFGEGYARVLARDLVLGQCGDFTAEEALRQGFNPAEVWRAVCQVQEIPEERWWGPDIAPKR